MFESHMLEQTVGAIKDLGLGGLVWEFNWLLNNHLIETVERTLGSQAGTTLLHLELR